MKYFEIINNNFFISEPRRRSKGRVFLYTKQPINYTIRIGQKLQGRQKFPD
jgi:hypothetical protein